MKKIVNLLLAILVLSSSAFAQKKLEAFFTYSTFFSPNSGSYIETYLTVNSSTLKFQKIDNQNYQGSIQITYVFSQNDSIKTFKKYNILSPLIQDTLNGLIDFADYQRISIPEGNYDFEIILKDNNRDMDPFSGSQSISIQYPENTIAFSDVLLLKDYGKANEGEFSKSGLKITPFMTDFYPDVQKRFIFYTELYNTDQVLGKEEPLLIKSYLKEFMSNKILNSWTKYKKKNADRVIVLLDEFNIEKLPSGNYQLIVEAINKENKILDRREVFFQRSNPKLKTEKEDLSSSNDFIEDIQRINSLDTIIEYVNCLRPISDYGEEKFIQDNYKSTDTEKLKTFFINFWIKRYPHTAELHWDEYKERVNFANKHYSTLIKRGYQSDRGKVFLTYGLPNQVSKRETEPSSYPYIIWQYYNHPKKSNAKYVFYNPDLVTNEYELLHSNVPGEINNYRWEFILQQRNTNNSSLDRESGDNHWGGRSSDYFSNPR